MKTYERFLNYVRIHTASSEDSSSVPTTERQFDLANLLVKELHAIGVENARVNDKCYVYASVAATPGCESCPAIGFIAHMDTVPDFSGENVQPRIIENYDGGDVVLGTSGRVLSPKKLPHLPSLKGKTLIVTDGTTVLGGDDKAGIAEIMTAIERVISENRPHGKLCIGFTPDEEVGSGADNFNVAEFGADFAYTVDGGAEGEIEYENFNAAAAKIVVNGFNIHPGDSKNKMINALLVAMELNSMLPDETPANTEGYEGFFHLTDMSGNVERAEMDYIIRDHSEAIMTARKATLAHAVKILNEKYGSGTMVWMIALTALVTGLVHFIFFPHSALLGASGVVFMMIVLSSFTAARRGEIPVTLILVVIFYLGGEIMDGLFKQDNVSQIAHIVGGLCGLVFGFTVRRGRR